MKKRIRLVIAMVLIIIVFSVVIIIASISAINKIAVPDLITPQPTTTATTEPAENVTKIPTTDYNSPTITADSSASPIATTNPTQTIAPLPTTNPNAPVNNGKAFAEITITTDRKTRTYDIMADVNDKTLKENIGWLPSSAVPGQEGMCVLMGHRDTDFSILKYAEYGNEFIVVVNGREYTYTVSDIEIINSDAELRFNAIEGKHLVLVTCYPFRYSGHAPQKILFYARQN